MIGKLKRSLCFTLIAALALSTIIFPASAFSENPYDFSDTKGHWAEEEIRLASCNRHTNGDRWGEAENYHLTFDSSRISDEAILSAVRSMLGMQS